MHIAKYLCRIFVQYCDISSWKLYRISSYYSYSTAAHCRFFLLVSLVYSFPYSRFHFLRHNSFLFAYYFVPVFFTLFLSNFTVTFNLKFVLISSIFLQLLLRSLFHCSSFYFFIFCYTLTFPRPLYSFNSCYTFLSVTFMFDVFLPVFLSCLTLCLG
jgi:hypothetical protein